MSTKGLTHSKYLLRTWGKQWQISRKEWLLMKTGWTNTSPESKPWKTSVQHGKTQPNHSVRDWMIWSHAPGGKTFALLESKRELKKVTPQTLSLNSSQRRGKLWQQTSQSWPRAEDPWQGSGSGSRWPSSPNHRTDSPWPSQGAHPETLFTEVSPAIWGCMPIHFSGPGPSGNEAMAAIWQHQSQMQSDGAGMQLQIPRNACGVSRLRQTLIHKSEGCWEVPRRQQNPVADRCPSWRHREQLNPYKTTSISNYGVPTHMNSMFTFLR